MLQSIDLGDKMKVIVAGSRSITDIKYVIKAMKDSGFEIDELVSGGAIGVDSLAESVARFNGIPVTQFLPDWVKYGKRAGFVRNAEMADYADALIAVWDGESHGTSNMIEQAMKNGLKIYIYKVEQNGQ
jgi:glycerophosphoryl diester phosphodiesterase